jgi:threonine/homoserine/homoserine lactone efflux protein
MVVELVAAAGVLALLTVVPGPDMAVVTRRALVGGRSDAVRAASGVVVGLLVWGGLAVLGLTALLAASPTAYTIVKSLGVAYLVWLAVQALRSTHGRAAGDPEAPAPGRPFVVGLTTNLLNPKIAVFYTALLPTLAPSSLPHAWGLVVLVLVHGALTLGWLTAYAHLLTRASSVAQQPSVRRTLDRLTGVVLIAFAVRLATQGP